MGNDVSNIGVTKKVGGIEGSAVPKTSWRLEVEKTVGPSQFSPSGKLASVSSVGQTISQQNLQSR